MKKNKMTDKLKGLKIHTIEDNRGAILDKDNKLIAQGWKLKDNIDWTWIRKDYQ